MTGREPAGARGGREGLSQQGEVRILIAGAPLDGALGAQLRDCGFKISVACSGAAAWDILNAGDPPRLMVLGPDLAQGGGLELARKVRANRLPVYVLFTGGDAPAEALEAGADDYLATPYDALELCARLRIGTRLLEMQAELARERGYLRSLMDNIPDCIYFKNADSRFTLVNRAQAGLLGIDGPEAACGLSDFDFLAPEFAREAFEDERKIVVSGKPLVSKPEQVRRPGWSRWVTATKVPVKDSEGCVVGIVGITRDITELKDAEEALRKSEEYFRLLFTAIPHPAWVYDVETLRFLEVNDAAVRRYGYSQEELRNLRITDLEAPVDEAVLGLPAGVSKHRTRDGEVLEVEVGTREFELHGRRAGLTVIQDITEHRRLEAELLRAKEAAESASRAKSEFLANMSHEIRTPMNGVLGMADLAMHSSDPAEQRECLTLVKSSGETLVRVINDVLDFSKIEAGRLELSQVDFGLRDALAASLRTVAVQAHTKGLELACDVAEDVPDALVGDPDRLRQVLLNLLGNAVKFTAQGEVVVGVRRVEESGAGTVRLHIFVRDTGIGIPPEKQRQVFDPFTQADGSTTRRYGGTGLGLTISKDLVRLMGGQIWLESEVGRGTTVHFTAEFRLAVKAAAEPRILPELAGLEVLIVDDNATNRRILNGWAGHWGMLAEDADNGPEALERIASRQRRYDAVFLDFHMPGMDGLEVARRIRRGETHDRTLILLLTSAGRSGEAARSRAVGIDACLTKPVNRSDLLTTLQRLLDRHPDRVENQEPAPEVPAAPAPAPELSVGLKVLLAEDNPVNQRLARRLLEKAGHSVEVAWNGQQAIDLAGQQEFDVIVMDVQMPEVDGFQATAAIREREVASGLPRVPIIAMTAHALAGDRERCLDAGMDGYVSKPLDPARMMVEISRSQLRKEAQA
jgi:two-component system sensor histidine kinase/response regulator